jgi:hypothetical protein
VQVGSGPVAAAVAAAYAPSASAAVVAVAATPALPSAAVEGVGQAESRLELLLQSHRQPNESFPWELLISWHALREALGCPRI